MKPEKIEHLPVITRLDGGYFSRPVIEIAEIVFEKRAFRSRIRNLCSENICARTPEQSVAYVLGRTSSGSVVIADAVNDDSGLAFEGKEVTSLVDYNSLAKYG